MGGEGGGDRKREREVRGVGGRECVTNLCRNMS